MVHRKPSVVLSLLVTTFTTIKDGRAFIGTAQLFGMIKHLGSSTIGAVLGYNSLDL
jgi:hypothetical protein